MLLNRSPEIDSSAFRVSSASSAAKPNPTPIGATQSEATSGQTLTRNALREDSFSLNAGRMMLLNRSPGIDSSAFCVSSASSTAKPNPTPIGATQSEATSGQTLTPAHQHLPNPHSPLRSATYPQRPPTPHYSLVPHEALDRGFDC